MPELRSARKNGHIYEEMASDLGNIGFVYTGAEVRVKLHNFSNKYRQERAKVGPSGGSPSTWKLYNAVHEALGCQKSYCADELTEDSIMVDFDCNEAEFYECIEIETDGESTTCPPLPSPSSSNVDSSNRPSSSEPAKNKKKTAVSVMEDMRTDFLMATQEMKQADDKRLAILQQYADNVSEMKDAFVEFLRRQNNN
ncbi:PREDICTED: uncharacterized protein LOC108367081 [Rhagoletis zephyria]|uniref:uncharacterized protein LOC108367081 n=2 Tax=Rhagoletis TaxID=28609 RepID=UPI0008112520|nr:PREDICTED: uncharacterized protein LOC108367081 [Rhagoletis zephyria]XP_036335436.1 uncharacterized protein LOC118745875 [Rhagoletis pomonella]